MPRKLDDSRVAEAARMYAAGNDTRAIAEIMHIDARTVQRWLGDQVRRPGPRQNAVTDQRILGYRDRDGLAFERIATLVGMSKTGVRMRYLAATGQPRPGRGHPS